MSFNKGSEDLKRKEEVWEETTQTRVWRFRRGTYFTETPKQRDVYERLTKT